MSIATQYAKPWDAPKVLDNGGAAYNVKHRRFGATADGVADDTAELQAAIDAAKASGAREIVLPPGVYGISAALVASFWGDECHGLTIRGTGTIDEHTGGATVIRAIGAITGPMLRATGRSMRGLHIEGIVFDADGLAQDCVSVAPEVGYSAWGITFERCWFQDYTRYGLRLGDLTAYDDGSGTARDYTGQIAGSSARDLVFQSYQTDAIAIRGDSAGAGTTEDFNFYNIQCLNASASGTTAHISLGAQFKANFFGLVTTGVKDDAAAFAITSSTSPVRVYGWTTEDPRLLTTTAAGFDADVVISGLRQNGTLAVGAPVTVIYWRGVSPGSGADPILRLDACQLQGNVLFGTGTTYVATGLTFEGSGALTYDVSTSISGIHVRPDGSVVMREIVSGAAVSKTLTPSAVALLTAAQTWTAQQIFERSASGQGAIQVKVTGEANPKIFADTAGRLYFGPGGATGVADYIEYKAANCLGLGANDTWRTGLNVTASRPAAGTVGAGAQFYDTTLSKPIWSDGTDWRDAAGTVV